MNKEDDDVMQEKEKCPCKRAVWIAEYPYRLWRWTSPNGHVQDRYAMTACLDCGEILPPHPRKADGTLLTVGPREMKRRRQQQVEEE